MADAGSTPAPSSPASSEAVTPLAPAPPKPRTDTAPKREGRVDRRG